jgi:hypothetical protein
MAAENSRMHNALEEQHSKMAALMARANRFESQSRSAQADLQRVRQQMHARDASAAELELLSVPKLADRVDAPRRPRHPVDAPVRV